MDWADGMDNSPTFLKETAFSAGSLASCLMMEPVINVVPRDPPGIGRHVGLAKSCANGQRLSLQRKGLLDGQPSLINGHSPLTQSQVIARQVCESLI